MRRLLICLLVLLVIPSTPLYARPLLQDRTVTLCGADNATGAGWNLRNALSGGNVIVRFNCGNQTSLRITSTINIAGTVSIFGGDRMTLNGGDAAAMFRLLPGASLRLNGLILSGGRYTGPTRIFLPNTPRTADDLVYDAGVIQAPAAGTIQIEDCEFVANVKPIAVVGGLMIVTDSRFTGNTRSAINIYRDSQLVVENSVFFDNTSGLFSGAINNRGGTLVIRGNSGFSGNATLYGGAAIFNQGTMTIDGAWFSRNRSGVGGAIQVWPSGSPVSISHARFEENHANREGGAINQWANSDPAFSLTIRQSTFVRNTADRGGAIAVALDDPSAGILTLSSVVFSRNEARVGGAIAGGSTGLDLVAGAIVGNTASEAGAAIQLYSAGHPSRIANTLIAGNQTGGNAASLIAADMTIVNTTIAENQGGIALAGLATETPPIELANTILFANTGSNCDAAPPTDHGHNLQFPGTSCGTSIPVVFPWLDARFAPYSWSPALGAGNLTVCEASPVNGIDLLGQQRGVNGACAIGALERDIERLVRPPIEG